MFRADVVVKQAVGLFGRKLQHPLCFRAEGDLHGRGNFLAENRATLDFFADILEGQVRAREDSARQPFTFANEAEKQVLGLNRDAAELARFVAGEEEDSSCPFGVPFEHPLTYVNGVGVGVTETLATLYGIVHSKPNALPSLDAAAPGASPHNRLDA